MDVDEQLFDELFQHITSNEDLIVMEFGVASGNMACALLNILIRRGLIPKKYVGYDSFKGLPSEDPNASCPSYWYPGAFNLLDENINNNKLNVKAVDEEDAMRLLLARFSEYQKHNIDVQLIHGFYETSLKPELIQLYDLKPAMFINIDCDMYISAIQALEFLVYNDLIADKCVIRYDDWSIRGIPEGSGGESKAHAEIVEKYNLNFELVRKSSSDAVFRFIKGDN